jgi:hypothetical protein
LGAAVLLQALSADAAITAANERARIFLFIHHSPSFCAPAAHAAEAEAQFYSKLQVAR